ncbi:MAG: hypothetical protein V3V26_00495 [Candidatus Aenigmarchaeota archaeon]
MKEEHLNSFCTSLLGKYRKYVKSIWFAENTISVLILDVSKSTKEDIEKFSLILLKTFNAKYDSAVKLELAELSDYFRNVMEGDIGTYKMIRDASLLYDPSHFVHPIKKMVKTGMIHGTKEALMRRFHSINQHFREISREKLRVLDNIYMSIIEASQAAILAAGHPIPVPKQVPPSIKKYFVDKGLLEKKYLNQCSEIVKAFKSVEHREKPVPSGAELDKLQEIARQYRERLKELVLKM